MDNMFPFFVPPAQCRNKGVLKCVYALHTLRALRMLLPCTPWRIHLFSHHSTSAFRWIQNTARFIHFFLHRGRCSTKNIKYGHNMDFSKTKKTVCPLSLSLLQQRRQQQSGKLFLFYFFFFVRIPLFCLWSAKLITSINIYLFNGGNWKK